MDEPLTGGENTRRQMERGIQSKNTRASLSLAWLVTSFFATTAGTSQAATTCFETFVSPPVFSARSTCTQQTCLQQVRMFQGVIFVPTTGSTCDDECFFTNVTITV